MFRAFLASVVCLFTLGGCSSSNEDYAQWWQEGILLDTRTPLEHQQSHINGSVLVPYELVPQRIAALVPDKNTPVLLYCRSGRRAGVAESALRDMGYTQVKNLGSQAQAERALGLR